MKCKICEDTGVVKECVFLVHTAKEKQLGIQNVWELCNCERGRELKEFSKEYLQEKEVPYSSFIEEVEE